jgi:hypothetical protein
MQHASRPPDEEGESSTGSAAPEREPAKTPAPAEPASEAGDRKPVERVIEPQPHEPADRTERYLRGPTAYCA